MRGGGVGHRLQLYLGDISHDTFAVDDGVGRGEGELAIDYNYTLAIYLMMTLLASVFPLPDSPKINQDNFQYRLESDLYRGDVGVEETGVLF